MYMADNNGTIDAFLELLRNALCNVEDIYYGRHSWNESMLNYYKDHFKISDDDFAVLKEYLDGYGERVFCYELYHQTRKLMENDPERFKKVRLQSELEKQQIGKVVEDYFKVKKLDKEFMPDFLLHTPLSFENQYLIIEVKSNADISFSGIKPDLEKIQQFISRYNYERGVFLTINTNPNRMIRMLGDEGNQTWIKNNIANPNLINFMCKKKNDVELFECTLDKLPSV